MSGINNRLNYVDGVTPSIGKRIATFAFGAAMFKFEKDKRNKEYKIYLVKGTVADKTVEYFKHHWPGFKILYISQEEAESEN